MCSSEESERLHVPRILGQTFRHWLRDLQGNSMVSAEPNEKYAVFKTKQGVEGQAFPGYSGVSPEVWLWGMDDGRTTNQAIDGVYTIMLRVMQQVSWRDRITNLGLYENLPKLSTKSNRDR